jgi:putative DNA primase/helicase
VPQTRPGGQAIDNIAFPWLEAGCSVIPILPTGQKKVALREWKPFMTTAMTEKQVRHTWKSNPRLGVAVICGKVSGNLEMLELEGPYTGADVLEDIERACEPYGVADLWRAMVMGGSGYCEWTPKGGIHFLYRISDHEVPGNTKVAQGFDNPEHPTQAITRAETRGEGGYVIVAPSSGECHENGQDGWSAMFDHEPEDIITITWRERSGLVSAIADVLDDVPPPPPRPERRAELVPSGSARPGDDFNERASWDSILTPHGWQVAEVRGQETLWVRPGKDVREGHSASTGYANDADRMFVWSTSAGLPTETPLSKFFVYTQLNHGGDWSSATRALSQGGYGGRVSMELEGNLHAPSIDELNFSRKVPVHVINPTCQYTDTGNSFYMENMAAGTIRYNAERRKWFIYNQDAGIWEIDAEGREVKRRIRAWAFERYERALASGNEIDTKEAKAALGDRRISAAMNLFQCGVLVKTRDMDAPLELLNMDNGTFNLNTMQLQPHTPDDLLTKKLGTAYDAGATAPNFEKFLSEAIPDEEQRRFLQRCVGYSLMGDPVERVMIMLHGPGGTGKSTFIETIARLFYDYAETATDTVFRAKSVSQVGGPSNDLMALKGARYVNMSELDYGTRMDEALIKRMTGRDRITSRFMYEENQTWMPQCVIWMATNHRPVISGDDGAIWDRIKLVPFHHRSSNMDKKLGVRLLSELPGIFNWALEGLREYREIGLAEPGSVQAAVAEYRDEQDAVFQFLEELKGDGTLVEEPGNRDLRIRKTQLYQMYLDWCRLEGERHPYGQKRFNARLRAHDYEIIKTAGSLYWVGLAMPQGLWLAHPLDPRSAYDQSGRGQG